jgi:hypothetical protein
LEIWRSEEHDGGIIFSKLIADMPETFEKIRGTVFLGYRPCIGKRRACWKAWDLSNNLKYFFMLN